MDAYTYPMEESMRTMRTVHTNTCPFIIAIFTHLLAEFWGGRDKLAYRVNIQQWMPSLFLLTNVMVRWSWCL